MQLEREVEAALLAIQAGARGGDQESELLEFKQDGKSAEATMDTAVDAALCLANADGGTVVVGIANDKRGSAAFVGSTVDPRILQRRIFDLSKPPLTVSCGEVTRSGVRLVIVNVPRSPELHADSKGRARRRIGTDCLPMTPAEIARVRNERAGFDSSEQPSGHGVADASPEAMALVRRYLSLQQNENRRLGRLSDLELLRAMALVAGGRELTRAGWLLLCNDARVVVVYQFRSTPAGDPKAVIRLKAPLLVAFDEVMRQVEARQEVTPVQLPSGQLLKLMDFPELAVREAVVNALIHRDLHLREPVQIEHSPGAFIVTSPGPLVSGVTPRNILTHPSRPRNPLLAHAFRILDLAEETGRGIDRLYREMLRIGRQIPVITGDTHAVTVKLIGGTSQSDVTRFVAQLPDDERDDTDTLLIIHALCHRRTVTALDLEATLQKEPNDIAPVLRRLSADATELLEPTRESASHRDPVYRLRGEALRKLGGAVGYQRRTVDEIDRKVVAHVREYGFITNRTVQNLLDVKLQRARGILADLVARNVLVKTSEHERGPGVQYGPGRRFPRKPTRSRQQRLPLED